MHLLGAGSRRCNAAALERYWSFAEPAHERAMERGTLGVAEQGCNLLDCPRLFEQTTREFASYGFDEFFVPEAPLGETPLQSSCASAQRARAILEAKAPSGEPPDDFRTDISDQVVLWGQASELLECLALEDRTEQRVRVAKALVYERFRKDQIGSLAADHGRNTKKLLELFGSVGCLGKPHGQCRLAGAPSQSTGAGESFGKGAHLEDAVPQATGLRDSEGDTDAGF
jgi:hypothetical protein